MKFKSIILFVFISATIFSQISPPEKVILNYNQIMFETVPVKKANSYKYFIAEDRFDLDKNIFPENKTYIFKDSTQAILIENLKFGKPFKWKVEAYNNNQLIETSSVHTFSIMYNDYEDESKFELKQTYNLPQYYEDGIIWCDLYHVAINRKGKVVWEFPMINKDVEKGKSLRDLHMYTDGSITFITDTNVYCINRDLEVLWSTNNKEVKSKTKKEYFHHSFKKLNNGNFMVLGAKVFSFTPNPNDTATISIDDDYVAEYDENGKVVWSWYTSEHFDLNIIKELAKQTKKNAVSLHMNSFSVDEQNNYIYVNYRDLSRILKIDKRTKKIVGQYGKKLCDIDTNISESHLFRRPHDVRILANNEMLMFNNNEEDSAYLSSALHVKLPDNNKDTIKVLWEFKINFDTLTNGKSLRLGSCEILPNGNYLICTGQNGRILEVTKDKKVVWDFILYERITRKLHFIKFPQYKIAYNSSLYPFYFTLTSEKTNKSEYSLKINNEGTDDDTYKIVKCKRKLFKKEKNIDERVQIKSNYSKTLSIKCKGFDQIKVISEKSGIERAIELN